MAVLEFRLLGPLQVLRGGETLDLGSRKQRALLALLLINRHRAVPIDRIVMALWGADAPDARRKDVWVYVSRLRKVLGDRSGDDDAILRRSGGGYVLDVPDESVDASRFERLVGEARRISASDPAAASLVLAEALALWEGDAIQEFSADGFAAAEVARWAELRLVALELRVSADMAWKDPDAVIPEIQALARRHPLRPELTASLMIALYRRGRQAEALQAYRRFAQALGSELGLDPPAELQLLEERILLDAPLEPSDAPHVVHSTLPAPIATFIGRTAPLDTLAELTDGHRLVTITGAGGIGKTSLAAEFGRRTSLRYEDVAMIDLTRAEAAEDIVGLLAEALRVHAEGRNVMDALIARIGTRRVLAILDNCDPVARDAAGVARRLLERAPGLCVLATSRVLLGVDGERVFELAPMGTSPGGEAEELLTDRVALLGDAVAGAVTPAELRQMCARTAGFPLLIELAASQLRAFSPAEVVAALDDQTAVLASPGRDGPERHRDTRANIAWSERLLSPASAALLRRLAVFCSSFTLEAVAAVAGFAPPEANSARVELRGLVDASLVVADRGSPSRYRLLEPVHHFAWLRLVEEGEAAEAAQRHAAHYLEVFDDAEHVTQTAEGLAALRPDGANLEAAIRFLLDRGDTEAAQTAAARAVPFWRLSEDALATLPFVEHVLAADARPTKARAALLHHAGPTFGLVRGRDFWYGAIVAELRAIAGVLDDAEVGAWLLRREADQASWQGDPNEAIPLFEQAIAQCEEVGLGSEAVACCHNLAWYLYWLPDRLDETEAVLDRWQTAAAASGLARDVLSSRVVRCWIALSRSDHALVESLCAEVAEALRALGDHRLAATLSQQLAVNSLRLGDLERAEGRATTALEGLEEMGMVLFSSEWRLFRAAIRVRLGHGQGAIADMIAACEALAGIADAEATATALAVLGRALVTIAPEQAATVLACHAAHGQPWMLGVVPRFFVPALDDRIGHPRATLRRTLGSESVDAAERQGAGMDPHSAYAETAERLAAIAAGTPEQ